MELATTEVSPLGTETHNLVIFNDKNLTRVATHVGAKSSCIKYSQGVSDVKESGSQGTAEASRGVQNQPGEEESRTGQAGQSHRAAAKSAPQYSKKATTAGSGRIVGAGGTAPTMPEAINFTNQTAKSMWSDAKSIALDLGNKAVDKIAFTHDLIARATKQGHSFLTFICPLIGFCCPCGAYFKVRRRRCFNDGTWGWGIP